LQSNKYSLKQQSFNQTNIQNSHNQKITISMKIIISTLADYTIRKSFKKLNDLRITQSVNHSKNRMNCGFYNS